MPIYCSPHLIDCQKDIDNEIHLIENKINYPMYAKPTMLAGSVGNFKIEN